MRILAIIVVVLGLAGVVLGIVFTSNAGNAEEEVAGSIAPLTLDQLDDKYEQVKAGYTAISAAEEPAIQAGTAAPSARYNYLSIQRASLGLAQSNVGLAQMTRTLGFINIGVGAGLILTGFALYRKI
jgi:hypothetical protein